MYVILRNVILILYEMFFFNVHVISLAHSDTQSSLGGEASQEKARPATSYQRKGQDVVSILL